MNARTSQEYIDGVAVVTLLIADRIVPKINGNQRYVDLQHLSVWCVKGWWVGGFMLVGWGLSLGRWVVGLMGW